MRRRELHQRANIIQPVGTADQRTTRLKTHIALLQMRVIGSNVRRVGDNQIKAPARQCSEPVTLFKTGITDPQTLGVAPGQRDGLGDPVHPGQLPVRALGRQRQRDRTGAGAEIQNLGSPLRPQFQRNLNQPLGIRARNQGAFADLQLQTPEALFTEQIGNRHTAAPLAQQLFEAAQLLGIGSAFRPGAQIGTGLADGMTEQQLGIQPSGVRVWQFGAGQHLGQGRRHAVSSAASWSA